MKKKTFYLLFLLYLIILIFISEQIVRIDSQRPILTYDKQLIWKYVPYSKITYKNKYSDMPAKFEIHTNALGFRDYDHHLKKETNTTRILFIGDSYTFGSFTPDEDTFVRYLETKLNKDTTGKYEIFNFGISAYATDQEYILLKNIGLNYNPDIVILTVVPNDIRETFMKSIFYLTNEGLMFNKSNKALNINFKDKFFWDISTRSQLFFRFQKLLGWNYGTFDFIANTVTEIFFKETLGLNADEIVFLKNETDEVKNAIPLFQALIEKMNELCVTNNVTFIIVNLPIKLQFDGSLNRDLFDELKIQKILKDITSKNGIALLDLYPVINNSTRPLDYYIREEYHLNQKGHKLVCDELYTFLMKENF